jgi:hypothetical protein
MSAVNDQIAAAFREINTDWRIFDHVSSENTEAAPDHSTISRTRRAIDLESHRAVFTWVQQRLAAAGLLKGKTVAVDATTLEANAAVSSSRLVKQGMRISRTLLSCLLRCKGYETSRAGSAFGACHCRRTRYWLNSLSSS